MSFATEITVELYGYLKISYNLQTGDDRKITVSDLNSPKKEESHVQTANL